MSRQSARHAVALGLVLLSVTVAGAALGGVTAAESQSSPVEISDWTDLQAIGDSQAALSDDYVLVNDLNKSTAGYNAVVLNQTATEFTEDISFDEGESRVNLTRTPVAELLSNDEGLNLTVVDPANGTIERQNTGSDSSVAVTYTTPTKRFVGFNPIGPSFSERFTGSFDGQGNTIRDLLIDRPTDDEVGLFGASEGTIKQVTVANATITGSADVGGLVGQNDFNGGTVSTSSASGAVTGSSNVGGLVGRNGGTVSTSSASGDVTGSGIVGGLVGDNGGTVSNSSASGAANGSAYIGGLVGLNRGDGIVSTSSTSGAVNGLFNVGGLVGLNRGDGTVSSSSASGDVTGSDSVGGLVGDNFLGTVSSSSASSDVTGFDRVGGLVGNNYRGTVSSSSASGDVTATGDFSDVGGLVGDNFFGTVSNSSASGAVNGSFTVGGLVGDNFGTVSTSSASGAVNGSEDVGGLVGDNGGTVSNSEASGAANGSFTVGGLVGDNGGTVSTSSASGAANGSDFVGGLVGTNEGTVSTSSASGAVTGSEDVGGLVGENTGTVSNSSASGAANGSFTVGGLVGENTGTVSNSSASGAVTGSDEVGGLVGRNGNGSIFGGTVSESFATGSVTGSSDVGGLVGQLGAGSLDPGEEAILRDSYYDTQTTGQQAAVGTIAEGNGTAELRGEVTGLPTSQMQGASAAQKMGALDFTSTWRVVTNPPRYPEPQSLSDRPDPGRPILTLSNLRIAGQGDTTTVLVGSYNVSVAVSHVGGPGGAVPVELTVGPTTITESITLNTSETTTVTFENATGDLSPGSYDVTVSAGNASVTGEVTLSVPVGDNPNPATDTDDDGLLEDVDGDGEFTIFDVQTLFVEFQSDPVQTNSGLFNFDGSGDGAVTIFDVQALFTDLS